VHVFEVLPQMVNANSQDVNSSPRDDSGRDANDTPAPRRRYHRLSGPTSTATCSFPVRSRASGDADPLPAALKITIRERMGIDRLDVNEHTDLTPT
jgi:hypothetical protein